MIDIDKIILEVGKSASLHPWRDICDCTYDKLNQTIRKNLEKELHKPPTSRDKEIRKILEEEKKKYELDKAEFEANPLHWTNNKRRRYGLPVLRGTLNKDRVIKFHAFHPTTRLFFVLEDIINEIIPKRICEEFGQFADIKDFIGDKPIWK